MQVRIHFCYRIVFVNILKQLKKKPTAGDIKLSFLFKFYLKINSVSLDPDEDKRDATIFDGLKNYMLNEMTDEECQYFKTVTLRNLAKRAQSLKAVRPPRGLSFSLQQQRM